MRAWFAAVALGVSLTAAAQTAQDELEKQLKDMVAKPPSKLLVEYEGLDQPAYKLLDVSFVLDGQNLPVPNVTKLNEGKTTIWHGDIKPGHHRLEYTASFSDVSGVLFSYEAGYKFKVGSASTFEQQPGLEVRVLVSPELKPGEKDPRKKFTLKGTADVKMLAKLEDGSMPDVPKPNLGEGEGADAGTAEVAKMTPAERAKLVAAEKAAAKKAADDAKKQAREDALAAKKAAAEEKKRAREEALAAKKRAHDDALAAKRGDKVATADTGKGTDTAKPPEPPPPEPVAEVVVDAGAPIAVAEPVKPPPAPTPAPVVMDDQKTSMLPIAIGGAVALLGVIVFLATRKKKAPPAV